MSCADRTAHSSHHPGLPRAGLRQSPSEQKQDVAQYESELQLAALKMPTPYSPMTDSSVVRTNRRGVRLACMKRAHYLVHTLPRSPTKGPLGIHEETMRPTGRTITYMPFLIEMFGRISVERRVALMLH